MLSLIAATILTVGQEPVARMMKLLEPNNKPARLSLYIRDVPLDPPKFSPKLFGDPPEKWQFDWIASAFGPDLDAPKDPKTGEQTGNVRFRVYSQVKKSDYDYTVLVARQAIRMWDVLVHRYGIRHPTHNMGIIDFYLCYGGEAGGEFLRGEELIPSQNRTTTVSTIYIYDIRSFTKPIEMAREVAHEYGHAVLPPVGGYTAPENWANGYLGEKMFMRILRDQSAKGVIGTEDTMGATTAQLDSWVKQNVEPLVIQAATNAPSVAQLADKGKPGMDAYMGLVLYADTIFPPSVVTRSMVLIGSQDAKDYPDSLVRAVKEKDKLTLSIPPYLKDKPIWVPLGGGKVSQAMVLKRSGDWAQIQPQAGAVVITSSKGLSPKEKRRR